MAAARRVPEIYGWLGDGELQVEICPEARSVAAAFAWVRAAGEKPRDWRVTGRVWAKYVREERMWWECDRDDPEGLEFWQLERVRW